VHLCHNERYIRPTSSQVILSAAVKFTLPALDAQLDTLLLLSVILSSSSASYSTITPKFAIVSPPWKQVFSIHVPELFPVICATINVTPFEMLQSTAARRSAQCNTVIYRRFICASICTGSVQKKRPEYFW